MTDAWWVMDWAERKKYRNLTHKFSILFISFCLEMVLLSVHLNGHAGYMWPKSENAVCNQQYGDIMHHHHASGGGHSQQSMHMIT